MTLLVPEAATLRFSGGRLLETQGGNRGERSCSPGYRGVGPGQAASLSSPGPRTLCDVNAHGIERGCGVPVNAHGIGRAIRGHLHPAHADITHPILDTAIKFNRPHPARFCYPPPAAKDLRSTSHCGGGTQPQTRTQDSVGGGMREW